MSTVDVVVAGLILQSDKNCGGSSPAGYNLDPSAPILDGKTSS